MSEKTYSLFIVVTGGALRVPGLTEGQAVATIDSIWKIWMSEDPIERVTVTPLCSFPIAGFSGVYALEDTQANALRAKYQQVLESQHDMLTQYVVAHGGSQDDDGGDAQDGVEGENDASRTYS